MKVTGRYGTFTPRLDQAAFYAKRAKKQKERQAEAARSLAAWLERHKSCANGCGKPVAFYDTVHYSLKHGGCCSAECEAELRARGTKALRECCNAECGWKGETGRMLGAIGPLCPDCGEVTEPIDAAGGAPK